MTKKVLVIIRQLAGFDPVVSKVIQVPDNIDNIDSWTKDELSSYRIRLFTEFPESGNADWYSYVTEVCV